MALFLTCGRFFGFGAVLAAAAVAGLAGCGGGYDFGSESREESHPLMRQALSAKNARDIDGAIAAYTRALEKQPRMARAHLQLAMLYDQEPKEDYARAIYHYERYLELSRDEKTKNIANELLVRARWSLGATLSERKAEAAQLMADLKRENAALREEIARLQAKLASARGGAGPTAPAPSAAPGPAPVSAPVLPRPGPEPAVARAQTYTVQSGDTLSIIAQKVYGDAAAWKKIFDANKSTLSSPGSVRPGQVLIIPR